MPPSARPACCAFALLTGMASGCAAVTQGDWVSVRSSNFEIVTDGDPAEVTRWLRGLEGIRAFMVARTGLPEDLGPLTYVSPRSSEDHALLDRDDKIAFGMEDDTGRIQVLPLQMPLFSADAFARAAFAEHALRDALDVRRPVWFRDGLSLLMLGTRIESASDRLVFGATTPRGETPALRAATEASWSFLDRDGRRDRREIESTQVKLLVHYAVFDRHEALERYFEAPEDDAPARLLAALGLSTASVPETIHAFFSAEDSRMLAMPLPTLPDLETAELTVEARDYLLMHIGAEEEASDTVRGWLSDKPPGSLARLALVERLQAEGELQAALREADALLALRPDSPRVWARKGSLLLELAAEGEREARLAEALALGQRANRARPRDPLPFEVIARAAFGLGRADAAVLRAARLARRRAPHREVLALLEVQILLRMGKLGPARRLAARLAASADDEAIKREARELSDDAPPHPGEGSKTPPPRCGAPARG